MYVGTLDDFRKMYGNIGEKDMDKVKMHQTICNDLNRIYEAKNHDYGDSFARVRKEYPQSINIRLWDKLLRLDQLNNGTQAKVKDESIEDTLLDMANYCIMEVIERRISASEIVKTADEAISKISTFKERESND